MSAYLLLFASAFGAATLLPLQSEAVLLGLLALGEHSTASLVAVATAGNVLGAIVNWLLGRGIERWQQRPWFPVSQATLAGAQRRYHRYGYWSLLLSWMPVIGDPLTVVAGLLREPLWRFTLLVLLAKLGRYLALVGLSSGIAGLG